MQLSEIVCPHCGNVDDYSKAEKTFKNGSTHIKATCNGCQRFIKWLPKRKAKTFIPFGKYKGKHTYEVADTDYLKWLYGILEDDRLKLGIKQRLKELATEVHE